MKNAIICFAAGILFLLIGCGPTVVLTPTAYTDPGSPARIALGEFTWQKGYRVEKAKADETGFEVRLREAIGAVIVRSKALGTEFIGSPVRLDSGEMGLARHAADAGASQFPKMTIAESFKQGIEIRLNIRQFVRPTFLIAGLLKADVKVLGYDSKQLLATDTIRAEYNMPIATDKEGDLALVFAIALRDMLIDWRELIEEGPPGL